MGTAALNAKDLREKSLDDLRELEKTKSRELFETRFKNFTNRLDDTSLIKKTKRELARIKTLLAEQARKAAPAATEAKVEAAPAAAQPTKKTTKKKSEAK